VAGRADGAEGGAGVALHHGVGGGAHPARRHPRRRTGKTRIASRKSAA
jgi:hypothetical protein